jgi:molecular chaperone HtpG
VLTILLNRGEINLAKKQFKAESKRLLDIMINSIYTHREIFLRELISNASDAIDKLYYKAMTDEHMEFKRDSYFIEISTDKTSRILRIKDTGIGMTKEEMEDNLGVIAKSGSLSFKKENELRDGYDIIGQFGVGFYSAFMVSDVVTVISRALSSEEAFRWESQGADGYSIEACDKADIGTEIILKIKENTEDEHFDEYLETYRLKNLIKKYSDFIRYPIKLEISSSRLKEGTESDYETFAELQTINSMVPLWRKNKNEVSEEDYENFYSEKHFGFDKPLKHIHMSASGTVSFNAILYIPETSPYDYYTKEFEKGLELYSSGVMIMNKCADLLPDYFSFVKGIVDSEDLSLNISREMLQHDRQLKLIAKNIKNKIKNELLVMMKDEPEKYETFFKAFGRQLKYGLYSEYGQHKDDLQDLLLFYSSKEQKLVSLADYVSRMPETQKYIYYATGETPQRIDRMPQTERITDKGFEILYFTEDVDEFAIRMLMQYQEKEFRSVSGGDLGIDAEEEQAADAVESSLFAPLFEQMKQQLGDKVTSVRASKRLKNHPVCLATDGELSIEMEKILSAMPNPQGIQAEKVLEINTQHEVFETLKKAFDEDKEKFELYTGLLYNQARLIEGLPLEDPVEFANQMIKVMK